MGVPSNHKAAFQNLIPFPASPVANDPNAPYYGTNTVFVPLKDGTVYRGSYGGITPLQNQFVESKGLWTLSTSLFKTFPIKERMKVRVQWDVFNPTNSPQEPQLPAHQPWIGEVAGMEHGRAIACDVGGGLADALAAAAVATATTDQLAQAIGGAVEWCGDGCPGAHMHKGGGIGNAGTAERRLFAQEIVGRHQHEARQIGVHVRHESGAAELGEGVVAAVGRHHVVGGLAAAIVAHDELGALRARQPVDDRSLAGIAEAEIDGEDDVGGHCLLPPRQGRPVGRPCRRASRSEVGECARRAAVRRRQRAGREMGGQA